MKKGIIVSVLVLFIVYTIASLFVDIPRVFNNVFYGVVSVFAIYFGIFYTDLGKGIKDKFSENSKKYEEKKVK